MQSPTNRPTELFIVVIDDTSADAFIVQRVVGKHHADNLCTWFADADEALDFLMKSDHSRPPDLVLLDIKMPKMTGLELLGKLDEAGRLPYPAPIIVLSSSTMRRDIDEAERFAGVSYKTKPSGYVDTRRWLNSVLNEVVRNKIS